MALYDQYKRLKANPKSQTAGTVLSVAETESSTLQTTLRKIEETINLISAHFPEAEIPPMPEITDAEPLSGFYLTLKAVLNSYPEAVNDPGFSAVILDRIRDDIATINKGKTDAASYLKVLTDLDAKLRSDKQKAEEEKESQAHAAGNGTLTNSLQEIMEYSGASQEDIVTFTQIVNTFRTLKDPDTTDARTLRKAMSDKFLSLYKAVFINSMADTNIPDSVKLFLDFGYLDTGLTGEENSFRLLSMIKNPLSDPDRRIYTFREWLIMIYRGYRMPSRSAFDLDYEEFLREKKKNHEITDDQMKQKFRDMDARVNYELDNLFAAVMPIVYGQVTSYSGFLKEMDIVGDPQKALLTPDMLSDGLDRIRKVDFGAFRRESLFADPDNGIKNMEIHKEIRPDLILMPTFGNRLVMWQEIEGRKYTTPGRFFLPIMFTGDFEGSLAELVGEFRWELCRRIQGAHWNDITSPCVTSEYYDYIATYKRNSELSQPVKDKIKQDYSRARNQIKVMFAGDYEDWVRYEAKGLPRLNKVARRILFKYCAFNKKIRESLGTNPLYADCLSKYNLKNGQARHRLDIIIREAENAGFTVPPEVREEMDYLSM
ncbi:MAG: hypothetical protein K6E33_03785 [Lachnospiraceae bacterium]|nr:hypothetical protein [Lachnospiraceae bacterium]